MINKNWIHFGLLILLTVLIILSFITNKQVKVNRILSQKIIKENQKLAEYQDYFNSQLTLSLKDVVKYIDPLKYKDQFDNFFEHKYVVIIPESSCGGCVNSLLFELSNFKKFNNTYIVTNSNQSDYYRLWVSMGFKKENFLTTNQEFDPSNKVGVIVVRTNNDFDIDLWFVFDPKYVTHLQAIVN